MRDFLSTADVLICNCNSKMTMLGTALRRKVVTYICDVKIDFYSIMYSFGSFLFCVGYVPVLSQFNMPSYILNSRNNYNVE